MTELEPASLPRREFLRYAAGTAGAMALGWETVRTEAAPEPTLAIAYWTGTTLRDARYLATGDAALAHSGVRLRVYGHSGGETLRALNAYYLTADNGHVPYHAWKQSALGAMNARFTMPVTAGDGILLSAKDADTELFGRLYTDHSPGRPKLRTGLYVLAVGLSDWTGFRFDPEALDSGAAPLTRRTLGGFVPARFGYRVLRVEAA